MASPQIGTTYIIIIMVGRRLLRGWRMAGQGRAGQGRAGQGSGEVTCVWVSGSVVRAEAADRNAECGYRRRPFGRWNEILLAIIGIGVGIGVGIGSAVASLIVGRRYSIFDIDTESRVSRLTVYPLYVCTWVNDLPAKLTNVGYRLPMYSLYPLLPPFFSFFSWPTSFFSFLVERTKSFYLFFFFSKKKPKITSTTPYLFGENSTYKLDAIQTSV